jgi:hypothetical protein
MFLGKFEFIFLVKKGITELFGIYSVIISEEVVSEVSLFLE